MKKEVSKDGFWNDVKKAGRLMKNLENIQKELESWDIFKRELSDLEELAKEFLKENEGEDEQTEEQKLIERSLLGLEKKMGEFERQKLFRGKYDQNEVIFSIHAGAGGVEAQDWAEMLLRMYLRYFQRMGFSAKILSETRGNEAGIKSVTIEVSGNYVFGQTKSENGVHRLVRLSPFNADNLRQTSFAQVEVLPIIESEDEIKINPADLRIDTFRASGAGGQHVNKTESAIRITHLPTGIVVGCQNERSQGQNKETAMKILRSKLAELREQEKAKEKKELKGERKLVGWGNQIRSYVLHPYQMVKDHRTEFETSQTEKVLDGEIEGFVEEYLRKN